jgi:hypothetical protein
MQRLADKAEANGDHAVAAAESALAEVRFQSQDLKSQERHASKMVRRLRRAAYKTAFVEAEQDSLQLKQAELSSAQEERRQHLAMACKLRSQLVLGTADPEAESTLAKSVQSAGKEATQVYSVKARTTGARVKRQLLSQPVFQEVLLRHRKSQWYGDTTLQYHGQMKGRTRSS